MIKQALARSLLVALCSIGIAQAAPLGSAEEQLAQGGMVQMSEGLYAKVRVDRAITEESYVATNREGEQALLLVLQQDRERFHRAEGRNMESPNAIDSMIEKLSRQPPVIAATTQDDYGNCNGLSSNDHTFHVNAAAVPPRLTRSPRTICPAPCSTRPTAPTPQSGSRMAT